MKVEVKLSGLDNVLETLQSLPEDVVSKRGGPVKAALAKGARFLRDKTKEKLRAAIALNGDESTGLLLENVIASRGKAPSNGKGERYLVRVKRKSYPKKGGETVTTHKTASLLEYGSEHQPATPWLRPAVIQHGQQTINVISDELKRRVDSLVKKRAEGKL